MASLLLGAAAAAFAVALSTATLADDAEIKAKAKEYTEAQVAKWVADADVVAAINAADAANASYDQAKIDGLDKQRSAPPRIR
jgi:membrane-bound lytic murein transglycosylase B